MNAPAARIQKNIDGFLLVDKPQEWTSHDVCGFIKKRYRLKKVGHGGTLDPLATGLLIVMLGKATKQSAEMSGKDKVYEGVIQLGIATDSHDRTGETVEEKPWEHLTLEDIREKAQSFLGDIEQIPPMVSAVKHQGVRLYKLARKGKEVERKPRPITVHQFDFHEKNEDKVTFTVHASKGTYVRTLAHDLGQALGSCATLAELRRTEIGDISVKNSFTIDELRDLSFEELQEKVLPIKEFIPA